MQELANFHPSDSVILGDRVRFRLKRFDMVIQTILEDTPGDIDLIFPSLTYEFLNSFPEWIKTQLLPYARRIRKTVITFFDQGCAELLFKELASVKFPRLCALSLKFPSE